MVLRHLVVEAERRRRIEALASASTRCTAGPAGCSARVTPPLDAVAALDVGEQSSRPSDRASRAGRCRGELQQVHLPDAAGDVVAEDAGGRCRASARSRCSVLDAGDALLFVVEEEERLVLHDRAALRDALLIVAQLVLRRLARLRIRRQVAVAEPGVRVQRVVPQVLVGRAGPADSCRTW